jgi:hypothetical protein
MTLLRRSLRLRRTALDRLHRARQHREQATLRSAKGGQAQAWATQSAQTADVLALLQRGDDPALVTGLWRDYQRGLRDVLLPVPPLDFLRDDLLQETMLVRGRRLRTAELALVRERLPAAALARALDEDLVGDPALACAHPPTSHTAIHHLHHLLRFEAVTGRRVADARVVVEWGGGFGGFARTLRRLTADTPPAHVIVDLPIVGALQWTYLTSIFGAEHVDLALEAGHLPRPGVFTIVPPGLAQTLDVDADLFVSLWAMSESTRTGQDAIVRARWFGAPALLTAFQHRGAGVPDSARVGRLIEDAGGHLYPIALPGGSSYGFR